MHTLITHSCDNIFKYKLILNVDLQKKYFAIKYFAKFTYTYYAFAQHRNKTLFVRYVAEQF